MADENATDGRPILILGPERSGASLVAELVHRWGAAAGDPGPLRDLLVRLQEGTAVREWEPGFAAVLAERAADPAFRERAEELVAATAAAGKPWFWMAPGLGFYLPFWERFLSDPLYIVVLRNPQDAAKSFEKERLTPQLAARMRLTSCHLLLWQLFMRAVLERAGDSVLVVSYEDLLRNPMEQGRRLGRLLDARCGLSGGDMQRLVDMLEAIDPGRWHQRSGDLSQLSPAQAALFEWLRGRAKDGEAPFQAESYPVPAFGLEYLRNIDTLLEHSKEYGRRLLGVTARGGAR